MPVSASAGYVQSFAANAASVLHRLGMDGVMVEATAYLLRLWVPVVGSEDGEAARTEAVARVEAAAGGWMAVDRPEPAV